MSSKARAVGLSVSLAAVRLASLLFCVFTVFLVHDTDLKQNEAQRVRGESTTTTTTTITTTKGS